MSEDCSKDWVEPKKEALMCFVCPKFKKCLMADLVKDEDRN